MRPSQYLEGKFCPPPPILEKPSVFGWCYIQVCYIQTNQKAVESRSALKCIFNVIFLKNFLGEESLIQKKTPRTPSQRKASRNPWSPQNFQKLFGFPFLKWIFLFHCMIWWSFIMFSSIYPNLKVQFNMLVTVKIGYIVILKH